jgi:hypothetical protein
LGVRRDCYNTPSLLLPAGWQFWLVVSSRLQTRSIRLLLAEIEREQQQNLIPPLETLIGIMSPVFQAKYWTF